MSKKMTSIYPRQNGKSTLALEFTRLQTELNEVNYKLYTHRVKIGLLENENQKLKDLLSRCVDELAEFNNSYYPETQELLTQIDEVLK